MIITIDSTDSHRCESALVGETVGGRQTKCLLEGHACFGLATRDEKRPARQPCECRGNDRHIPKAIERLRRVAHGDEGSGSVTGDDVNLDHTDEGVDGQVISAQRSEALQGFGLETQCLGDLAAPRGNSREPTERAQRSVGVVRGLGDPANSLTEVFAPLRRDGTAG